LRQTRQTDYLFPSIIKKIQIEVPFNAQGILTDLTLNTKQKYTLHCFRRGGAQFRFFGLKRGKWTLTQIKSWGGWAKGEKSQTLIHYLLNELESIENYYGDLCAP
jgi:hypothetical protein